MLMRRLYSSCSRSAPPVENAVKPHAPTRGRLRLKPNRVSQSQTLSKLTRPRNTNFVANELLKSLSLQDGGRGRKGRRTWLQQQRGRGVVLITATTGGGTAPVQIPFVAGTAVEGFKPVHLYPVQAALHFAFTPPHLPLPVNLGARMYTSPNSETSGSEHDVDRLFTPPPRPSPVSDLSRTSDNILGDHQTVIEALSHPVNAHHLGSSRLPPSLRSEGDGDTMLARMIAEAGVKWRLSPEAEWEKTIARLSSPAKPSSNVDETRTDVLTRTQGDVEASAIKTEASVHDAVTGLEALLDKLKMNDDKIDMTSVKRKRQKKISKHKYKKRRKVSLLRAERNGGQPFQGSGTLRQASTLLNPSTRVCFNSLTPLPTVSRIKLTSYSG